LLKCGYCHRAMRVVASGRCIPRITCSGKTNYGTCQEYEKRWLLSELEALVERELLKAVQCKQELCAKPQQQEDMQQKRLKVQIAKAETKIDNLLNAVAEANEISAKYLNKKILSLEEERRMLEKEWQLHQAEKAAQQDILQFGDISHLWDQLALNQKHQIGKLLIDRIWVYNDRVQILWNYHFMEKES